MDLIKKALIQHGDAYDQMLGKLMMRPCQLYYGICPEPEPCGKVPAVTTLVDIHTYVLEDKDLADQILKDFVEGYEQAILWGVLEQVFDLDISAIGGRSSNRPQDRIRDEVESLFARNQGPHYRELLYETLEEYL